MGAFAGPNSMTDGLVFGLDAANTDKSWKGAPTTNLANTGAGVTDWTFIDLSAAVIIRSTLEPNYKYQFVSTIGGGGRMRFNLSNLVNAETYNLSFKYKITAGGPTFTMNDWCDTSLTKTTTEYPTYTFETAFGSRATYDSTYRFMDITISDNTTVEVWDFQLENRAYPTPYAQAVRSNTESLIDMIGGNTITASSLTYNTDNTFEFNGTNDTLTLGNPVNLQLGSQLTVEAVVRPDEDKWMYFFFKAYAQDNSLYMGRHANGSWFFGTYFDSTYNYLQFGSATVGDWFHLALTYDKENFRLYENGILKLTDPWTEDVMTNSYSIHIGGDQRYWSGQINTIKVYDKVLTDQEVNQNFNAIRGRFGI